MPRQRRDLEYRWTLGRKLALRRALVRRWSEIRIAWLLGVSRDVVRREMGREGIG